ncbi:hypothetical protein EYF80_064576 [Liparis tanakae]|uniref:Uncharacterized protein n=1 Tax=Liparis tanakae TaxID=230148 RepID=A0A4Z2E8Q8_9TELE|nr:hypothetical protein EYF80_064576 [Liparis tanakae]
MRLTCSLQPQREAAREALLIIVELTAVETLLPGGQGLQPEAQPIFTCGLQASETTTPDPVRPVGGLLEDLQVMVASVCEPLMEAEDTEGARRSDIWCCSSEPASPQNHLLGRNHVAVLLLSAVLTSCCSGDWVGVRFWRVSLDGGLVVQRGGPGPGGLVPDQRGPASEGRVLQLQLVLAAVEGVDRAFRFHLLDPVQNLFPSGREAAR